MGNFDESGEGLRSSQRAKRRKTNLLLNGLIGLVLLLILIVSITIFSKDDEQTEKKAGQTVEEKVSSNEDSKEKDQTKSNDEHEDLSDENNEEDSSIESEPVITDGGEANVKKTIINPAWNPVGTSQTGEHVAVYDESSVDWREMVESISYATGLEGDQLILWRLENNGPNQSVGTVSTKDKLTTFRVYIEWQDNEGWAPTRVEELIQNDKAQ